MMKRFSIFIVCFLAWSGMKVHAQLLALKTNALMDVAMVPNLGLEVVTGGKTSLNASVFGTPYFWGKDVRLIGVKPEFRYWFNGRPLTREFIGIGGTITAYDITWGHWSMECHAGIGLLYYNQQRYYLGDRVRDNYYNANGFHLVPYDIGVTFVWIINSKVK